MKSYMDALIQQGQVWVRPILPPKRPGGIWGSHPRRSGVGKGSMLLLHHLLHLLAEGPSEPRSPHL